MLKKLVIISSLFCAVIGCQKDRYGCYSGLLNDDHCHLRKIRERFIKLSPQERDRESGAEHIMVVQCHYTKNPHQKNLKS